MSFYVRFKQLISLFWSFFKIGCFTFGGGYAMVVMMQRELVNNRRWVSEEEFIDYLALAQSSPGPVAINTSILIGYKQQRYLGAVVSLLGTVLPSFAIMLGIAMFFRYIYNESTVKSIFKGIRPVVVALILYPVILYSKKITKWEYPIYIVVAVAIYLSISPIIFIIGAIICGLVIAHYKK